MLWKLQILFWITWKSFLEIMIIAMLNLMEFQISYFLAYNFEIFFYTIFTFKNQFCWPLFLLFINFFVIMLLIFNKFESLRRIWILYLIIKIELPYIQRRNGDSCHLSSKIPFDQPQNYEVFLILSPEKFLIPTIAQCFLKNYNLYLKFWFLRIYMSNLKSKIIV